MLFESLTFYENLEQNLLTEGEKRKHVNEVTFKRDLEE